VTDSSPGWCPGVVLPRFTPGRKVTSPLTVCRANRPFPAVAGTFSPATVRNAGAHDASAGGDGIRSMPRIANAGERTSGAAVAPVSGRHRASVTTRIAAAFRRPNRGRRGARTRWLGKSPTQAFSVPGVAI
jgi:hypothetical protein